MKTIIAIILMVLTPWIASATNTWSSDGTDTGHNFPGGSVQWIHDNQAQDGDTITLPQDTFSWTTGVVLTKAITLQGSGGALTTINNSKGNNMINVTHANSATQLITRITGIKVVGGSPYSNESGIIRLGGDNKSEWRVRVDHCTFQDTVSACFHVRSTIGVIDHCTFTNVLQIGLIHAGESSGTPDTAWKPTPEDPLMEPMFGDGSWADPTQYATDKMCYFEDNVAVGSTSFQVLFDGSRGGRFCVRHNTFTIPAPNTGVVSGPHGTEGRKRSIRHCEFYNNYVTSMQQGKMVNERGGTLVVFNNRVMATTPGTSGIQLNAERATDPISFGRSSGSNPVDLNDTSNGGTNGNPVPFFTGTGIAGTTTDKIYFTGGNGWPVDKWVGYSVSDISKPFGTFPDLINAPMRQEQQYIGSIITSSGSDAEGDWIATAPYRPDKGPIHNFEVGDQFKIFRVLNVMDNPGVAGVSSSNPNNLVLGSSTTNKPPIFPYNATPPWNNQVVEPCYEWNNIGPNGTNMQFSVLYPDSRINVHFFNDTVKLGYPWNPAASTKCGADFGAGVIVTGEGGYVYPHPLVSAVTAATAVPPTTSTANGTSYASNSFTPAAGDLLVVLVTASGTYTVTAPGSMTDSQGLGFTRIANVSDNNSSPSYLFVANNFASASSMTVTFDCTGDAATGAIIEVFRVSGMSKTGSSAVAQVKMANARAAGSTPSIAFDNAAQTGNPTIGLIGQRANPAALTEPSGWTEASDSGYSTPNTGQETVYKNSGLAGTTVTWGSTAATIWSGIIAELDASAAP